MQYNIATPVLLSGTSVVGSGSARPGGTSSRHTREASAHDEDLERLPRRVALPQCSRNADSASTMLHYKRFRLPLPCPPPFPSARAEYARSHLRSESAADAACREPLSHRRGDDGARLWRFPKKTTVSENDELKQAEGGQEGSGNKHGVNSRARADRLRLLRRHGAVGTKFNSAPRARCTSLHIAGEHSMLDATTLPCYRGGETPPPVAPLPCLSPPRPA